MLEGALGYLLEAAVVAAGEAIGAAVIAAGIVLVEVIVVIVIVAVVVAIVALIIYAIIKFVEWLFTVAIPWIIETAVIVWDAMEATYDRIRAKIKDWSDVIPVVIVSTLLTHFVYRIYMVIPGDYQKRSWGFGWSETHNYPADCDGDNTFKWGITMFTVPLRYRRGYIYKELFITGRLNYQYIPPTRVHVIQARVLESTELLAYHTLHSTFPPGNSKFG